MTFRATDDTAAPFEPLTLAGRIRQNPRLRADELRVWDPIPTARTGALSAGAC